MNMVRQESEAPSSQEEFMAVMIKALVIVKTQQYISLTTRMVFIYHYFHTLPMEVDKIWSGEWKMGKILFLLTTYSVLARIFTELPVRIPIQQMTAQSCWNYNLFNQLLSFVVLYAPAGSILLTLHALLGAKRKHLLIITTLYTAFMIFAAIMMALGIADVTAQPPDPPASAIFSCMFQQRTILPNTILTWGNVIREGTVLAFGAVVMYRRYREQNDFLIRTIRRDGALYLTTAFVLGVIAAGMRTPGATSDKYAVIMELRAIAYPILANRLLINLRDHPDYSTRTAISAILFEHTIHVPSEHNEEEIGGQPVLLEEVDSDPPNTALATGVEGRAPLSARRVV